MKLLLVGLAITLTACSPKSQEEIAIGKMQAGINYIKQGDMMMACLTLTEAQGMFKLSVPNGKAQAQSMAPAVNKACNG